MSFGNSLNDKFPLIKDIVEKLYEEWSKKNKRANILIVGKTGVGKSTLINEVFRKNLAETGIGRPVTQRIEEITSPGMPLTILDSKGLELEDYETIKGEIVEEVRSRQGEDPDRYIHLAWLCISEDSKRIEDAEVELAKSLKALGVEVVIVITKTRKFKDNEFQAEVEAQFRGICSEFCLTHAVREPIYGDDDEIIGQRSVRGIDELISVSYRYIPESQRQSFANVLSIKHRQSLTVKRKEAERVVMVASTAAAAAAATPLPFSDAIALVPIQIGMILKVSHSFGIEVTRSAVLPATAALLGSAAATTIGRTLVSSILKLIPGIGSLVGGAISAAIAQQLTSRLGSLYIDALLELVEANKPLELTSAIDLLKKKLRL